MQKIEFALIAALYDSKNANFYRDIYFPIIKYSIAEMYYENLNGSKFFNIPDLQNSIATRFGVNIPQIVLEQAIKAIEKNNDEIRLRYFKDGQLFKVFGVWDLSINESIDGKAEDIRNKFEQLELTFQHYLTFEGLDCDKTFFDFFSDYSEDTFLYIETGFSSISVDEKYTNLASFINWVKKYQTDLYDVVADVFWASIIAGFLRRSKADLGLKAADNTAYYLDSSLILAMLDLDSEENSTYAKELLVLIKTAGATPKVHSITIKEVSRILESVEHEQGPRAGSAIEMGYIRQGLTPSLVLKLRNNLEKELEGKLGFVIDRINPNEISSIENKLKNNSDVKFLAEKWNSTNDDRLREIHDIYMCNYVNQRNSSATTIDKYNNFFITKNIDLLAMAKEHNNLSLLHPGQLVLNLWIHNATSSIVKKSGLVESISRCFAMNQTDVRNKLKAISRYISKDTFSPEDIKYMYSALIKRSKKAIENVDELIDAEGDDDDKKVSIIKILMETSKNEEQERQHSRLEDKEELQRLETEIDSLKKTISAIQTEKDSSAEKIITLQSQIKTAASENNAKEKEITELKGIIEQNKKKEELRKAIDKKKISIQELDTQRQKSVRYFKFWFIIVWEFVFLVGLFVSLTLFILAICKKQEFGHSLAVTVFSVLGLVPRCRDLYILTPIVKRNQIKEEQLKSWNDRHPEYLKESEDLKKLEDDLREMSKI